MITLIKIVAVNSEIKEIMIIKVLAMLITLTRVHETLAAIEVI